MQTIIYFAYGSNMLTARLQERCPSAKPMGSGIAQGFELKFTKISNDGSGKATLIKSTQPVARVYGVLFEIAEPDLAELDRLEGRGFGYDKIEDLAVTPVSGDQPQIAASYIATNTDETLKPYDWYKALVIAGATDHKLPARWIEMLTATAAIPDPNPDHKRRLEALKILKAAGHPFLG